MLGLSNIVGYLKERQAFFANRTKTSLNSSYDLLSKNSL